MASLATVCRVGGSSSLQPLGLEIGQRVEVLTWYRQLRLGVVRAENVSLHPWGRASNRQIFALSRGSCGGDAPYTPSDVPRFTDVLCSPLAFAVR